MYNYAACVVGLQRTPQVSKLGGPLKDCLNFQGSIFWQSGGNTSRPTAAICRHEFQSTSFLKMDWCLIGANPFLQPMVTTCHLEQIFFSTLTTSIILMLVCLASYHRIR